MAKGSLTRDRNPTDEDLGLQGALSKAIIAHGGHVACTVQFIRIHVLSCTVQYKSTKRLFQIYFNQIAYPQKVKIQGTGFSFSLKSSNICEDFNL